MSLSIPSSVLDLPPSLRPGPNCSHCHCQTRKLLASTAIRNESVPPSNLVVGARNEILYEWQLRERRTTRNRQWPICRRAGGRAAAGTHEHGRQTDRQGDGCSEEVMGQPVTAAVPFQTRVSLIIKYPDCGNITRNGKHFLMYCARTDSELQPEVNFLVPKVC